VAVARNPERTVTITSLGQIEALSNPLRNRILRHARRPVAVAELAERFGVPKTRLYYHVNLLAEQGMLEQVDERKSGARIEKIYMRTGERFQLGSGLAEEIGDRRKAAEASAALLLEPARAEVEDLIEQILGGENPTASIGRTIVELTPEEAERFSAAIEELVDELRRADRPSSSGSHTYSYTSAFVPIDTPEEPS
jgi:DNA-binding transcriptional ArsR family regulator